MTMTHVDVPCDQHLTILTIFWNYFSADNNNAFSWNTLQWITLCRFVELFLWQNYTGKV